MWDNHYLMGSGVNGRLRLAPDLAIQVLELAKKDSQQQ